MKNILIVTISLFFFSTSSKAQLSLDVLAGVHSYDLSVTDFSAFKAGITESSYGVHLGLRLHAELGALYIEPGLILNNISAKYTVDNPSTPIVESSNLNFDIPVVLGINIGFLNLFAGPVAHIRFKNYEDIKDLGGYEDKASKAFFGGHLGLGVIYKNLGFDLRYEKNFADNDFGSEVLLNQIKLIDTNSRVIGSVFLRFGGGTSE